MLVEQSVGCVKAMVGSVARAKITDGGGGLCLPHSGIWTLAHCNAKPQDALSARKRHNQNADENDGCGSLVSDGLVGKTCSKETRDSLGR